MEKILGNKRFNLAISVVLFAVVVLVYSNTFNASFHFDDTPNIVENYKLRTLKNLPEIISGQRGVTMATFAVNYAIGGLNVIGYHVVNILIHIITAILAYFLVLETFKMASGDELWGKRIAAYSALLFAVHPIQTQSVTYIVQRMESLASLFYLAAILIFIKAAKAEGTVKRALLYGLVVIAYFLGFHSKEIAITLPLILFLYDIYFISGRDLKKVVKERWPVYAALAVLFAYLAITTIVPMGGFGDLSEETSGVVRGAAAVAVEAQKGAAPSVGFGVESISPKEYLYTQFNVLIYYISLLFVPVNQNLDYDFPISTSLFSFPQVKEGTILNIPIPPPIVSLAILSVIIALGVYFFIKRERDQSGRRGVISFFIFWFFIILSPTSSFIPVIDVIFEHRVYLASLGFFVVFAVCFDWFFEWLGSRSVKKVV